MKNYNAPLNSMRGALRLLPPRLFWVATPPKKHPKIAYSE